MPPLCRSNMNALFSLRCTYRVAFTAWICTALATSTLAPLWGFGRRAIIHSTTQPRIWDRDVGIITKIVVIIRCHFMLHSDNYTQCECHQYYPSAQHDVRQPRRNQKCKVRRHRCHNADESIAIWRERAMKVRYQVGAPTRVRVPITTKRSIPIGSVSVHRA